MKRYKASSRQGLREGLGCRFVRFDGSALGLEPAFRRGIGLGVELRLQIEVNNNRTTRLALSVTPGRPSSCSSNPPDFCPHTPAHPALLPDHTIGGGGGRERQTHDYMTCNMYEIYSL